MKSIAFIGLGIMGQPMATNLRHAGYSVRGYTRRGALPEALTSIGVESCSDLRDLVSGVDVIITMLGFPQDVEDVYFGENGIMQHAKPGAVLIDMTTSRPELAVQIEKAAKDRGLSALDAPVTGGQKGAQTANLSIMVGGEEEAFRSVEDILLTMGKRVVYMGPAGSGQVTKLSNQMLVAGAIAGVCEGLSYAMKQNLDLDQWMQVVSFGGAKSTKLEVEVPKIRAKNDQPGFKIRHFVKDLHLAEESAKELGLDLSVLHQILANYEDLLEEGMGDYGTQALIHHYLGDDNQ